MQHEVLCDVVAVGVDLVPPVEHLLVVDHDAVQLVAERHPVGVDVVRPPEQLDLARARGQPLDDAVDLVGLVARGPDLEML